MTSTIAAGQDDHTFKPFPSGHEYDLFYRSQDKHPDRVPEIFHATWSTTLLRCGKHLMSLGHQMWADELKGGEGLHSPFGDTDGLLGCLSGEGRMLYYSQWRNEKGMVRSSKLERERDDEERPLLSHVTRAGNGRVVVTFKQTPNAKLTHVAEFASLEDFRRWHKDPAAEGKYPAVHHMVGGRPKQLIANAANFVMLMEGGEVYTWGDPRFRTLARPTTGEGSVPASQAGFVEALGGLKIEKVACGAGHGWLSAALSEDGAVYLWGTSLPGGEAEIRCLKEAAAGEVVLVELPAAEDGAEPEDVLDVGVGTNHVALVTASGRLCVVGVNKNGQLGLGSEQTSFPDWTEVTGMSKVQRVFCAPKATFMHTG